MRSGQRGGNGYRSIAIFSARENTEVLIPQYCYSIAVLMHRFVVIIGSIFQYLFSKENGQLYKFIDSRTNFENDGNGAPELWQRTETNLAMQGALFVVESRL